MNDPPSVLIPHQVGPWTGADLHEKLLADPGAVPEETLAAIPGTTGETVRNASREPIPESVVSVARTPDETRAAVGDADVVLTFRFDDEYLDDATNLRWIQAMSAGVDHFDRAQIRERSIALTNAAGVHAEPIGEQVLGYLLSFERGIHQGERNRERGVWERYAGGELRGKTLGVIGLGAIGTRVAELGQAFGMRVVGTKRDTGEVPDPVDEVYPADDHFEVLLEADHVVLACPLTDETRGLIGGDELRAMDDEAVLVNVARGGVVNQDALVRTLQADGIGGAALDVFDAEPLPTDSPLWDLSNVIASPHMAGSTPHYLDRCVAIFRANFERFRAGEPLVNRVE